MIARRRSRRPNYFGFAVVYLVLLGWVAWLAADRAWSQAEADRGIHGNFQSESCQTQSLSHVKNASRNGPGSVTTTYRYDCTGTFTPDNGQAPISVAYVTSTPTMTGQTVRAVAANDHVSTVYAEGGSYAQYVLIAVVILIFPVIAIVLGICESGRREQIPRRALRGVRRSPAR